MDELFLSPPGDVIACILWTISYPPANPGFVLIPETRETSYIQLNADAWSKMKLMNMKKEMKKGWVKDE
ncbi:hypothetical protein MLD38_030747 [Melastoma candidum]|uniref:Uncharacterized protein n=1 Tax=Melastoma candidum TaxID=119954 RepID=A0ACB9MP47_9MYRT|nr:hypothetical protein MLD38_030747 [Melastoma candidum]